MEYFVHVLSGTTKQGSGPLTAITDWTVTRRMDAAGSWSFRVVAADAQAAQLVLKRTCEIYCYIGSAYTYIGGGSIDQLKRNVDANGIEMLTVTGDDQLRELMNRTTNQLLLAQDDVLGDWAILAAVGTAYRLLNLGSNILLAAAGSYIYRSIDNGANWIIVFTSTGAYATTGAIDLTDCGNGVVLAAGGAGLQRSTDYGQTWTNITTLNSDAVLYLGSNIAIYARYNGTANAQYIYRSTDSGATWDAGRTAAIGANTVYRLFNLGGNNIIGGCSGRYVCRSTDNGVSFGSTTTPNGYGNINYSLVSPVANTVLAGSDTGYINKSTNNGANWSAGAYLGSSIAVRALTMFGSLVIAGAGGKVFASSNNGSTFTEYGDLGSEIATYSLLALASNVLAGSTNIWIGRTVKEGITHSAAVDAIEALAPAGWTFVADGTPNTNSIFIQFAGESVLTAALLVAERSGTHCYLSATKTLTFSDTWTDSGVHAVAPLTSGGALAAEVVAITQLMIEQAAYDVVSRVYPLGKMADGTTLIGIGAATISPGTGYTANTSAGYVENDAAITAYGTIERMIVFSDIVLAEDTPSGRAAVADALVRAAVTYLDKVCTPTVNYRLHLAGCTQLLTPMATIRLSYIGDVVIQESLYILESTWRGDESGMMTTELIVADEPVLIESDVNVVAKAMLRIDTLAAR